MTTPPDGWERDEREVLELEGVRRELEALRALHALRPDGEARVLARIRRDAPGSDAARARGFWRWGLLAAAAATILVVAGVWTSRQGTGSWPEEIKPPEATVATPATQFRLALEKPDLRVSPSALAWRGPGGENTLLADLKPAFDAFRADDYSRADTEFSALSARYPASVEITLYQGVARLFLGNVEGAIASLTLAEGLADSSLAWEVAWYRAVADERAGNLAAVRGRLAGLCGQSDARATIACDALKRLPSGGVPR
jgi:hypothetical protein